ncbi:MAG: PEGA domain-containing protein [Spirochaetia bacterium]|jgi:hypothetical protein|nr:PEGA domain-containing protein [Spirochaetia bacterium]
MGRLARPLGTTSVFMVLALISLSQVPCQAQSLTIGFCELSVEESATELLNAAVLVPRQLMDSLDFVKLRYPDEEELVAIAKKTDETRLEAARKAVSSARSKRDITALSVRDPSKRAADILSAESSIRKAETALENLQKTITQSIPDYGLALAIIPWSEHKNDILLPPTLDPASLCFEKKLDMLVYGSMRGIGDYIAVELSLYVASLDRTVWSTENFASKDGLDEALQAFIRPAAKAIMGTNYARIVFRISPPDAELLIDEVPFTESSVLYYSSGQHKASAVAHGFSPSFMMFQADLGKDLLIDITLEEMPARNLMLTSQPTGASIHLDGFQAGYTPLDVAGAAFPRVARVSMPGFDDTQLVLRPESTIDDRLIELLPSDGLVFNDRFDERKGAFYRSLGWFVASLPVPVIAGGLFQTYLSLLESLASSVAFGTFDVATATMLETKFYTSQTIFWASAAVTAGTAINALFKLRAYIDSAR